ncbi:hypothetical protein [Pyramidobacter sp.]|uniref:hypothetical protein n=1 Tax=Pyramidobacter sp. TaxID=1943581 RepID=UPI002A81868B|nr:hypothetical protein [Pyramidobacter sp.]
MHINAYHLRSSAFREQTSHFKIPMSNGNCAAKHGINSFRRPAEKPTERPTALTITEFKPFCEKKPDVPSQIGVFSYFKLQRENLSPRIPPMPIRQRQQIQFQPKKSKKKPRLSSWWTDHGGPQKI